MACPRIVGLDVSPVTASSRTYRASAPVRSITRLMLSSHRLWPAACSRCAGFSSASMRTTPIGHHGHLRYVAQNVQTVEGLAVRPHHHWHQPLIHPLPLGELKDLLAGRKRS